MLTKHHFTHYLLTLILSQLLIGQMAFAQPACGTFPCDAAVQYQNNLPYPVPSGIVRVENRFHSPSRNRVECDHGTGTLIEAVPGRQYIVTAAHLFASGVGTITVCDRNRNATTCEIAAMDTLWDVAVLRPNAPLRVVPVPLARDASGKADRVWAVGYGPAGQLQTFAATVLGYTRIVGAADYETLKIECAVRQGDSGGPVLNSRGELCGVVWGTDGKATYSTSISRVRKSLANLAMTDNIISEKNVAPPPPPSQKTNESPAINAADEKADDRFLAETYRNISIPKITPPDVVAPCVWDAAVPLMTAFGWSTPISVAAYYLLKLAIVRRRRALPTVKKTLNDEYAEQLNQVYELSGRTAAADATLGRLYDQQLVAAEQSTSNEIAKYARQLRKTVAGHFFRIHSTHPSPAEPIG